MANHQNPGLGGNPHFVDVTAQTESDAQLTSATLALAYEQRTANLIALWSNPEVTLMDLSRGEQRTCGVGTEVMDKVLAEIIERLGL